MEQSFSWEAYSHSASQEISHISWIQNIRYHVHKTSPLVPILSQTNPVHIFPPCFYKIHFNTNLPSMSTSPKWFYPSYFLTKLLYVFIICPMHAKCPAHLTVLDVLDVCKLWSFSLCSLILYCYKKIEMVFSSFLISLQCAISLYDGYIIAFNLWFKISKKDLTSPYTIMVILQPSVYYIKYPKKNLWLWSYDVSWLMFQLSFWIQAIPSFLVFPQYFQA
jgi:hypothetical protein